MSHSLWFRHLSKAAEVLKSLLHLDMCNDLQITKINRTGFEYRLRHYSMKSSLILPYRNGTIHDKVSQHWVVPVISFSLGRICKWCQPGDIGREDGIAEGGEGVLEMIYLRG